MDPVFHQHFAHSSFLDYLDLINSISVEKSSIHIVKYDISKFDLAANLKNLKGR